MPLTQDVLQTLVCCIDEEGHIIEDPVLLPCGHNACKKCVALTNKKPFECTFDDCNQIFQVDDEHPFTNNKSIEMLLKTYLKDLFAIIQEKVRETIAEFENMDYEKKIDKNCDLIAKEINIRVETLKSELDNINLEFQQHVKNLKVKLKKLIPNNDLESMRNYMLRVHNYSVPNFESLYEYQSRLKAAKETVKEFSKVNIYPLFEVSDLEVKKSLVGNLIVSSYNCYMLKKRILSNTIKFVDLKHKPSRICAIGKSMLCVSHSDVNKINVYSKDFEFIKTIEKINNMPLNNPTAIASDGRKYIYICDTGNNRILLCNLKFNLIEVFDERTLGEYELNRPTDIYLHNYFIYISDNLGARIHKFSTDMSYIESYDVNQNPFQIAILNNILLVSDQESHSSHFYDQTLFPSSNQNSRTGSVDGGGEEEQDDPASGTSYLDSSQNSPCCESYDNEGPICTVDNSFVQWNKYTKVFHFYDHEGKLESTLRLKSLIKTEAKKKQFRHARLYRHEKFQSNRRQQLNQVKKKTLAATNAHFERVTRENFPMGNTKNQKKLTERQAQAQFSDDLCYFNGKLVVTYYENKLVII